jgi:hypothetical protein
METITIADTEPEMSMRVGDNKLQNTEQVVQNLQNLPTQLLSMGDHLPSLGCYINSDLFTQV